MNIFADHHLIWQGSTQSLHQTGYIVRGWNIDGEDLWNKAMDSGVVALASDKVAGFSWAAVGAEPFTLL